ncbi:hypothetical protein H2198_007928 [Neophaeococcomyces mojaviensis]|uniref:Uncharacterized protein n=1 Tax=Neophaeococcomyces mojaviensis TaxID=3383035 RepID=A0ACC2ZYR7_9EURO|nr:hypothetical protein H2198_007928 [Knufia sp. JES_112]
MEISFNVPKAGPLTQVGLQLVTLDTAVYLATSAIGWWKARERSQSLSQALSAANLSLVSTSAFDVATYRERRKEGTIQTLGIQGGLFRRFQTRVESTAVSQHPGVDCLRALATGLLCLCSVQLTTTILADLVPFGLLQGDYDDKLPSLDGPLHASLKDWVSAVAAEEDCNTLRENLLQRALQFQQKLLGFHTPIADSASDYDELPHLLGCLRWMITPKHKRSWGKYPTRSLRVWTVAAIMMELAFSISVSMETVYSKEQYEIAINPSTATDNYPDVILVTASAGPADPWILSEPVTASLELRPRVIPVMGIPYAAFGSLSKRYVDMSAEFLVEIWKVSYHYARNAVESPTLSAGGKVHLKPISKDKSVFRDSHKLLLGLWSPHLAHILGPAMNDYVPAILGDAWAPDAIKGFFDRQANSEPMAFEDETVIRNIYQLIAIMLGTIYGACSKSLRPVDNDSEAPNLHDKQSETEFLDVAFSPDVVLKRKVFDWAGVLGLALSGLLDLSNWTGLLLELVTGIEHDRPLDEQPSAGLLHKRLKISNVVDEHHVRVSDIFGAQANGVFAISDFAIQPSSSLEGAVMFHVGKGRILNLPIDEKGYLRASKGKMPNLEFHLDPEPELEMLTLKSSKTGAPEIRIDPEPHWSNDPQTICFAVRHAGTLVANLNLTETLERLMNSTVSCRCPNPTTELSVPRNERWQFVTVTQLLNRSMFGSSKSSAFIRDQHRIVVDVQNDHSRRAYVVGIVSCRKMAICDKCIYCAHRRLQKHTTTGSAALIIG